jgi:ferredoxin
MKAKVDPEKCQGHARCFQIAPEVFHQDEDGYSFTTDEDVPVELEEKVREAVLNCPESAISIVE